MVVQAFLPIFLNAGLSRRLSCHVLGAWHCFYISLKKMNKCDGFIVLSLSFSAPLFLWKLLISEFVSLRFQIAVAFTCNGNPVDMLFILTKFSKERFNSNFRDLLRHMYRSLALVTPVWVVLINNTSVVLLPKRKMLMQWSFHTLNSDSLWNETTEDVVE